VLSPAKWCAGLLATDLVGELRLLVFPVLPGRGKRLFDDRSRIGIPARGIEGMAQRRVGQSLRQGRCETDDSNDCVADGRRAGTALQPWARAALP
jgi:hypothetical protein